jgi:hypothetical protein
MTRWGAKGWLRYVFGHGPGAVLRVAIPGTVGELANRYPGLPVQTAYGSECIADLTPADLKPT